MSHPCPSTLFFFPPPQRVVFGLSIADLGVVIPASTPGCQLLVVHVLEPLGACCGVLASALAPRTPHQGGEEATSTTRTC